VAAAMPFFADQPFWGSRLAALGVGPRPIPRAKLTAERLASAIVRATTNPAMQSRVATVDQQIRAEDGVARAVVFIEKHFG